MKRFSREKIIIAGALLLTLLLFWVQHDLQNRQQKSLTTLSNQEAKGLSIAREYWGEKARLGKKPFLFLEDLDGVDAILVDSPQFQISAKESEVLKQFLTRGGHVFVNVLKPHHFSALRPLFKELQLSDVEWVPQPGFVNGEAQHSLALGRKVYANHVMKSQDCDKTETCFRIRKPYHRGLIEIQAGLSSIANGLLKFEDNQKELIQMGRAYDVILLDGYHQFMSEKSWGDFLTNVKVILPLLTFIACLIFFMIFSPRRKEDEMQLIQPQKASYHQLYSEIMSSSIQNKKAWPRIIELYSKVARCRVEESTSIKTKKQLALILNRIAHEHRERMKQGRK